MRQVGRMRQRSDSTRRLGQCGVAGALLRIPSRSDRISTNPARSRDRAPSIRPALTASISCSKTVSGARSSKECHLESALDRFRAFLVCDGTPAGACPPELRRQCASIRMDSMRESLRAPEFPFLPAREPSDRLPLHPGGDTVVRFSESGLKTDVAYGASCTRMRLLGHWPRSRWSISRPRANQWAVGSEPSSTART